MEHRCHLHTSLCSLALAFLLSLSLCEEGTATDDFIGKGGVGINRRMLFSMENRTAFPRKLHLSAVDNNGDGNRVGTECSKEDIVIFQGSTAPLPNGVPAYTVQILNTCVSGCSIANIHISCGWFTSVRLVNPKIFRRVCYNDCLLNDGQPLGAGQTLSFQYANSFAYPLSVSSVVCR